MTDPNRECYDTPWKRALRRNLPDCVLFFFAEVWALLDWRQQPQFRDKELEAVRGDGRPRTLIADVLASVRLLDGRDVLLHIEVQAQRDPLLAQRMLDYNYTLFRTHGLPVISLVVLADSGKRWRPTAFYVDVPGTQMGIRFTVAKLADYASQIDTLLASRNVFAWVTAAHLLAQQTHGSPQERYRARWRLIKLLYKRGGHRRRIIELLIVVGWLLPLPAELEHKLLHNTARLGRRYDVELSPFEQVVLEDLQKRGVIKTFAQGRLAGKREGELEGKREGKREGAAELLERQLSLRFGPLSDTVRKRLARASDAQLAQWGEAILEADSLRQVFARRH